MANRENIFLRKDGRFEARYRKGRNNNGKLIYGFCYGKTYEEAQEKARRLQKAACAAEGGGQGETTFAHYCDGWLISNKRRLKESSSAKYLADIKNHIIPFFGKKLPWEITSEETDLFVQLLLYEKNCRQRQSAISWPSFTRYISMPDAAAAGSLRNWRLFIPGSRKKIYASWTKAKNKGCFCFLQKKWISANSASIWPCARGFGSERSAPCGGRISLWKPTPSL